MTLSWHSDEELFRFARRDLYTAVIGDIMDQMGLHHQFLPPQIRPLAADMVVVGRAMTVLEADCLDDPEATGQNPTLQKPFGLMLEALDDLQSEEVYLCTGASPTYALWRELMSTRARVLGAAGAVLNGYVRDTHGILTLDFPTFCYGSYAQDQAPRGKVIDFRVPIQVGNVAVRAGDIAVGDIGGVCIVPQEAEEWVFTTALKKARGEKRVKHAIEAGVSATEAFSRYGIL